MFPVRCATMYAHRSVFELAHKKEKKLRAQKLKKKLQVC